jgi:hypothetical protein
MFVGDEVRLDVGFAAARERLTRLSESGVLFGTSEDVYGQTRVGLAGVSKLVRVQVRELSWTDTTAGLALRWEATGPGGRLFPVLDADLKLAPTGDQGTLLTMAGAYRPPLGSLGGALDRAVLGPGRRGDHPGFPRPGGGSDHRAARIRPWVRTAAAVAAGDEGIIPDLVDYVV